MTSVALPVPSSSDRLTFASKNEITGVTTHPMSEGSVALRPSASYIHGNSLIIVPSHEKFRSINVAQVVTAHVSATQNYVVGPGTIFARSFEGMIKPVTAANEVSLSRTEKIRALLDGATSIFALGGKRPQTSTDSERDARVARRRAGYRRYIGGREY